MTKDNISNLKEWLDSIEYELGAVKFFLRRNQITKAHLRATFCCEFADEMLDIIGKR